jgi:hypothetical protein
MLEEKKEKRIKKKVRLLKEHGRVIKMFTLLFLGFVVMFFLIYTVLPDGTVGNMFEAQIETVVSVNSSPTGAFMSFGSFFSVLSNNVKLMLFCLVFSFFYGAGAIFILSWNASVLGVAIGELVKSAFSGIGGNFYALSLSLLGYFVYGIPEMVAYFIAGLAGGIISVAAIREHFMSKPFVKIAYDSLGLLGIALLILVMAAAIETVVMPLFI